MQSNETLESNEGETPEATAGNNAAETNEGEKPYSLAAALLADEKTKPRESAEKAESQEGSKLPTGLHALAEKLGVKPEDLYALEIPLASGKAAKLGELKDVYADKETVAQRELEIEERRVKIDADLTQAKSELEELMAALPENAIKPEVLKKVRDRAAANRERERVATLDAIPEWSDEATRTNELKGMVEMLSGYGFPPQYIERALDHRFIRLARDSWLRKVRIEKALASVRKVDPTPTGKGKKAPPADNRGSSKSGSRQGVLRTLLDED